MTSRRPTTIGVLGGGQLGRMLALEARRMGQRLVTWTGTPSVGPAAVANHVFAESFECEETFASFVSEVQAVSVEFENVPGNLLERLAERTRVAPGAKAVSICQHREREKGFLSQHGFPCAKHWVVASAEALATALQALPGEEGILKTAEFGYDGKGQRKVRRDEEAAAVWSAFDAPRAVLEECVDLAGELSVMVVRDRAGEVACYDPAENFHHRHILDLSLIPARYPKEILTQSQEIAKEVARALDYEGVMAVEFFLSREGQLLVNELAPRPHNSGHHGLDACQTSQFEQQFRVAAGWPIGGTELLAPAVMWNLLGDLWPSATESPDWSPILETPGAKLHLYGKDEARVGRKMGHVTFTAPTLEAALAQAHTCRQAFAWEGSPV